MLDIRIISKGRARQGGASAVEFGIIAILFFTLFFGIIEFGRFFYLYNTVQEVTRCAARKAVVTWKDSNSWDYTTEYSIQRQCLFLNDDDDDDKPRVELVAGWEIRTANIRLRALNLNYGVADPGDIATNLSNCVGNPADTNCIRFVEASLWCTSGQNCDTTTNRITYQPMFGLIPLRINIPSSTVTMPAESLGYGP